MEENKGRVQVAPGYDLAALRPPDKEEYNRRGKVRQVLAYRRRMHSAVHAIQIHSGNRPLGKQS